MKVVVCDLWLPSVFISLFLINLVSPKGRVLTDCMTGIVGGMRIEVKK